MLSARFLGTLLVAGAFTALTACLPKLDGPDIPDDPEGDFDGDGLTEAEGDCDDEDASVGALRWFEDLDGDGYGNNAVTASQCEPIEHGVLVPNDCNDTSATIHPDAGEICNNGIDDDCDKQVDGDDEDATGMWYRDADGDGEGDPDVSQAVCAYPGSGWTDNALDCDDTSVEVNTQATESCDNAVDDDCDGLLDADDTNVDGPLYYADTDGDGVGAGEGVPMCADPGAGYSTAGTDCDDTDPARNPNADEECEASEDLNCDGSIGNDDQDEDGIAACDDCDDGDKEVGARFTVFADIDGDGYGNSASPTDVCVIGSGQSLLDNDCVDTDPRQFPGAVWYRDADKDGFGDANFQTGGCTQPVGYVGNADDCNDASPIVTDKDTWYTDADHDGFGDIDAPVTTCDRPPFTTFFEAATDCDDTNADINPDTSWYLDNDGDGVGNEDIAVTQCTQLTDYVLDYGDCDDNDASVGFGTWYPDVDEDGYGDDAKVVLQCTEPDGVWVNQGGDCDDLDAAANPDTYWYKDGDADGFGDIATETQSCEAPNGYVEDYSDCNDASATVGGPRRWYFDQDGDGYGTSKMLTQCNQPSGGYVLLGGECVDNDVSINPGKPEICYDLIDQNCSGVADEGCPIEACKAAGASYTITANETWTAANPHHVRCDLIIANNATVTVEPGAMVTMGAGASITVGGSTKGAFVANSSAAPIVFTSDSLSPAPGDWDGITFSANTNFTTSKFTGVNVKYAGGGSSLAAVVVDNATVAGTLTLSNNTIEESASSGLRVAGTAATPIISGNIIKNNGEYGILVDANSGLSTAGVPPTLTGNTVTGNASHPIRLPNKVVGEIAATNTLVGNDEGFDSVYLDGAFSTSNTVNALDVPYYIPEDLTISGTGVVATLADGVEWDFAAGSRLIVAEPAKLVVSGSTNGVLFTSAAVNPGAGDWDGVEIRSAQANVMTGLTLEYAGGDAMPGALYLPSANPLPKATFTNGTIQDNATTGVRVAAGTFTMTGSDVQFNEGDGLQILGSFEFGSAQSFHDNTVSDNLGYPLVINADQIGELDGPTNSFVGNVDDVVRVASQGPYDAAYGVIKTTQAWDALDVPVYFPHSVSVTEGAVLTIGDGADLLFASLAAFGVGEVGNATGSQLIVNGTTLGVTMRPEVSAGPGSWPGIIFGAKHAASGSEIRGLTIEEAGGIDASNSDAAGCVSVRSGNVAFIDSIVQECDGDGIYAYPASTLSLSDMTIRDVTHDGVFMAPSGASADARITSPILNTVITRSGRYPISLALADIPDLEANPAAPTNQWTANGVQKFNINSQARYSGNMTVPKLVLPYITTASQWYSSGTITFSPGVRVENATTVQWVFYVDAVLRIQGTTNDNVVFTSSLASPYAGAWAGILAVSPLDVIDNAIIEYGGGSPGNGNIDCTFNAVTITNTQIRNSGSYGLYRCTGVETNVTYSGNVGANEGG